MAARSLLEAILLLLAWAACLAVRPWRLLRPYGGELPPLATWAGAALTLLSGMYILYRERKERSLRAALSSEKAITINNHEDAHVQLRADQITRITKETNQ